MIAVLTTLGVRWRAASRALASLSFGLAVLLVAACSGSESDSREITPPEGVIAEAERAFRLAIPSGTDTLFAEAHQPMGDGPHPTVLYLPGYGSARGEGAHPDVGPNSGDRSLEVARGSGWNVVRLHVRGYWGSGGGYSYANQLADTRAALAYLRSPAVAEALAIDPTRIVLVGGSMGGGVALLVTGEDRTLRCVAGIAPFNLGPALAGARESPAGLEGMVRSLLQGAPQAGLVWVDEGEAIADLMANVDRYDALQQAEPLAGRSVLIVGATNDRTVPLPVLHALRDRLDQVGSEVTYLELDDDHAFQRDPERLGEGLAAWLDAECR
jgi:dienelactone hydrolase